ncbi:MAG: xanthine dehydrogenase family protein subunit M [Acidobacteria bacterium]|nr:xanthine dehydrogenase family protein subunit M [Acidobacteriota bacterium]
MFAAPFEYARPQTLEEALALLARHGDDAKLLAGGHSLIPAMKLRLAQPKILIDLARLDALRRVDERDGRIAIGALVTHAEIASNRLLASRCPLLTETAAAIGDMQVRNKGTIGGSLAHADPAADWPAAVLALEAEIEIAGPAGRRTVKAGEFFTGLFETAVGPNDILCEIRVAPTSAAVAYVKTEQKASGFAVCGVAALVDAAAARVRVGVTGVASVPYRAAAVERALDGQPLRAETIAAAARHAADGITPLGDMHASADYRAHLAAVNTARALRRAAAR